MLHSLQPPKLRCCWPRSISRQELQGGGPTAPPSLAAASRLPSAVLLMGLCQEWSQVLCSWISSVIWAAA